METTVKTGWLEDNNGKYFAPKTLTSQVQTHDGTLLEDKLAETYVNKEEIIDIKHGGTGATTAEEARAYLGITPANIGAAPAGYGLGESEGKTLKSIEEMDTAIENGWYNIDLNGISLGSISVSSGEMLSISRSANHGYQELHAVGYASWMRRVRAGGIWGEWEWIEPPLLNNLEYRTIERVNNKAVYKKRLDSGVIQYRLDGETEWKDYAPVFGAAPASHTQAASTITAGTFAGQVVANSSGQTPDTMLLRNSKLVTTDTNPTVNGEICWTYE